MTIRGNYEVSSEGAVRHWEFDYTNRLSNNTPTPTQPAMVTSVPVGTSLMGTVLVTDARSVPHVAVVDVTHSMVYRHNVRNVITYNAGAENTFRAINEGDPVFYDNSNTMPADYYLSTSPLNRTGGANPLFGFVVCVDEGDRALYPLGGAAAASFPSIAVMKR